MNGVAAIAGIAVTSRGLQQSLGLLSRTELQQSLGLLFLRQKVAAIAGIAVTNRKLQQSLGLLFLSVAAEAGYCRS